MKGGAGGGEVGGWGSQTKNPSKRNISRSLAKLEMYHKNIDKTCRQASGLVDLGVEIL